VGERTAAYASMPPDKLAKEIKTLEKRMHELAQDLRFEEAAQVRDQLLELKHQLLEA
jgi:excinuclease ABC subunit B